MPHTVRTVDALEVIVGLGRRLDGPLDRKQMLQLVIEAATTVSGAASGAFVGYSAGEEGELPDGVEPAVRKPAPAEAPDPSQLDQERVGRGHGRLA